MAVNIYGLQNVDREPGAVLKESEAGVVTFTETRVGRPEDVEQLFFSLTRRSSTSDDFPSLSLESKKIRFGAALQHKLDLVWAGTASTQIGTEGVEEPVWILKREPSDEPIETHPDFAEFAGQLDAEENNAVFDPDTGLFEGFQSVPGGVEENPFAGVEKFLDGGAVVQKTSVFRSVPSSISTQPIPVREEPQGAPWDLPAGEGRTWMKTDLTIKQQGSAFEVVEEWKLSGQRGWNETIYPE